MHDRTELDRLLVQPVADQFLLRHIKPFRTGHKLVEELARVRPDFGIGSALGQKPGGGVNAVDIFRNYVVRDGVLIGVIPERLLGNLLYQSAVKGDVDLHSLLVDDVMALDKLVRVEATDGVITLGDANDMFFENNFAVIPVVDAENHYLYAVERGAIHEIQEARVRESEREAADAQMELRAAHGMSGSESGSHSWGTVLRERFAGVMVVNLYSFAAFLLLMQFEGALKKYAILGWLIPSLLSYAEAIAMQSHHLALHNGSESKTLLRKLLREGSFAFPLAAFCGLLVGIVAGIFHSALFGLGVAAALAAALVATALAVHTMPTVMRYFRFEPRLALGACILAVADLVTILIVFGCMH